MVFECIIYGLWQEGLCRELVLPEQLQWPWHLAGDLFKGAEQSRVLGLVEASNGFGKVISPIIGSLLALIFWYAAFFAFPIFCFISILLTIFFIKEKKAEKEPPPVGKYVKGLISVFKTEGRWLFAAYLTGATCLFALFGILFYISDILEKEHQIDGVLKGGILSYSSFVYDDYFLYNGK